MVGWRLSLSPRSSGVAVTFPPPLPLPLPLPLAFALVNTGAALSGAADAAAVVSAIVGGGAAAVVSAVVLPRFLVCRRRRFPLGIATRSSTACWRLLGLGTALPLLLLLLLPPPLLLLLLLLLALVLLLPPQLDARSRTAVGPRAGSLLLVLTRLTVMFWTDPRGVTDLMSPHPPATEARGSREGGLPSPPELSGAASALAGRRFFVSPSGGTRWG